ncbi:hypothetical protein ACKWTF_011427 [Chironomus riparius]
MNYQDLISLDECEKIVKASNKSDDVEIVSYHISQFGDGFSGFLGEYFILLIKYHCGNGLNNELKEGSFFIKSLPTSNEEKRRILTQWGIFRKEVMIFEHLIPKLVKYSSKKWSPHCYLARDGIMVFENLELTDYRTLPRHIDPSINHIKMALRTLALFQASSIIYERLELRPNGEMSIGDAYKDMLFQTSYSDDNPWCMTSMRAVKTVALHYTKYGIGSSFENAIQMEFMIRAKKIFEILDSPMPKIPYVLCHRDLWRNNLMYRFDNNDFNVPLDCILIDFQIARYYPLALDVIICIMLPSIEITSTNIDECIKFYYDQFSCELMQHNVNIENLMSLHDFEDACEKFKLMPLLMQPMFCSLANLPVEYIPNLLKTDEEKYVMLSHKDRDPVIFEFMDTDEYYRSTMVKTTERLIEYLFADEIGNLNRMLK